MNNWNSFSGYRVDVSDDEIAEIEQEIHSSFIQVAVLVSSLEARESRYPIEILNETRSILLHLSYFKTKKERDKSVKHLLKARDHVRRALLDCYKYLCVSYEKEILAFREVFDTGDLKRVDNGHFLPAMENMHSEAKKMYIEAKTQENARVEKDDVVFGLFECACKKYEETTEYIGERRNAIDYAYGMSKEERLKQEKREKRNYILTVIGVIASVLFGIFGVLVAIFQK